jgi:uncharacterized protein (DUF58 family)|tara:strand:+ start:1779 stop:2627 length:849 start_codon:yes stop_codon:yes gene_type:complete
MIKTDFLHELDRFSLVVHKRVTSNYAGPRRSIAFGRGVVFKDHRIYAPGDDYRAIDWKVFARTDDLYIKTYEEERNLVVHIIVDFSSSMNFGKPITKFDYASMIGVGFAYLAMKDNEKIQFSTFADTLEVFQPKKGMSQLAAMVEHMNSIKMKGKSNVKDAMKKYKKMIGSRAMIIIMSDFLINIEEIKAALHMLGNHEIKVIQVLDPVEKGLKLQGDYKLRDSETGQKIRASISPRLRSVYQKQLDEHCDSIADACLAQKIDYHLITTDVPIFDAFYEILK